MWYLLLFHGNNAYAKVPHCCIYTYISCLIILTSFLRFHLLFVLCFFLLSSCAVSMIGLMYIVPSLNNNNNNNKLSYYYYYYYYYYAVVVTNCCSCAVSSPCQLHSLCRSVSLFLSHYSLYVDVLDSVISPYVLDSALL